MTPEEWGYSVVGSLGPTERDVHMEIVRRVAEIVREIYEDAARIAEEYRKGDPMAKHIAAAIRALKEPEHLPPLQYGTTTKV
jgi:hypothetical protein